MKYKKDSILGYFRCEFDTTESKDIESFGFHLEKGHYSLSVHLIVDCTGTELPCYNADLTKKKQKQMVSKFKGVVNKINDYSSDSEILFYEMNEDQALSCIDVLSRLCTINDPKQLKQNLKELVNPFVKNSAKSTNSGMLKQKVPPLKIISPIQMQEYLYKLSKAIESNNLDLTINILDETKLIDHQLDASVNMHAHTLLHLAALQNSLFVNLLLKHGANPNVTDFKEQTPLHYAARFGKEESVKFLLQKSANTKIKNAEGFTPLHEAAYNGHFKVVTLLYDACPEDLTQVGCEDQMTALHLAAMNCQTDVTDLLLQFGASPECVNIDGYTPLHMACGVNDKSCPGLGKIKDPIGSVRCLMAKGASVNARTNEGYTPLALAIANGHIETASILLKNSAEVDLQDNEGWTPLHLAAKKGYIDGISLLIQNGADETIKNNDHRTPIKIAPSIMVQLTIRKALIQRQVGQSEEHYNSHPISHTISQFTSIFSKRTLDKSTADDSIISTTHTEESNHSVNM